MEITPLENWIIGKSDIGEKSRVLLEAYQLRKIREAVDYAKSRSRFYREKFKDIEPDKIRGMDNISQLPFTYPEDIRKNPFSFLCVPQNEVKRIVTLRSTGTSGNEKRIFFTEEDLNNTVEFFAYGMSCLADVHDRVMVLLPGIAYGSIGDLLKKALEKMNIECHVHGVVNNPEETAEEILQRNITCVVGIPIQVLMLSRLKSDIFRDRIRSVLLSGDYVPEVLIRELTDQCGCRVFTHYGMTEMGYGGGVECGALNGYHMREANLYFEIIDPLTGQNVPDGQLGEVVFTTLSREAMPLIRYRTGDLAAFSAAPCACGTFLKTMKRIRGRINNKISLFGNVFLHLTELDENILSFREVRDYKACLYPDYLSIQIVTEDDGDFLKIKDRLTEKIQKMINVKLGYVSNLTVRVVRKSEPDKIVNSMVKRTISDFR